MATAGKLQHDHLTCSICMEVFQQPVSLVCQHSFCKNCLTTYLETQTEAVTDKFIPCPTCRQETPVLHPDRPVEEWAGQLKPGLLLTGLMDSLQETTTCYSCREKGETTPATHWCSECEESFCDACNKRHRKMSALLNHVVGNLAEASSIPVIKRKFMCREHDEKMKLYCKDCKKPLCTVCCSISHRKCEDVVTIQQMLPEVKGQLQDRHTKLQMKIKEYKTEIVGYEKEIEKGTNHKDMVQSEIEKTFERFMEHLLKKKEQLLKKLEDQSGEQSDRIRSKVKTKQNDVQLYQKQTQCIQQPLELEDEAKLFDMYLSSGSGAVSTVSVTERRERTEVATINFVHDLEGLEEQVDKMDVKKEKEDSFVHDLEGLEEQVEKMDVKKEKEDSFVHDLEGLEEQVDKMDVKKEKEDIFVHDLEGLEEQVDKMDVKKEKEDIFVHDLEGLEEQVDKMDVKKEKEEVIDLAAANVELYEVIVAKCDQHDSCDLRNVAVWMTKGVKVTVATDYNGNRIKSFFTLNDQNLCSSLVLDHFPFGIAVLNDAMVAVCVPFARQIITVHVLPDLELNSTITTDKEYCGLDVLDQSSLVATSMSPPSVDILDLEGRVIRSLQSLPEPHMSFMNPGFLHVTKQRTILVSDRGLNSVICLTPTGSVMWISTPTGDIRLRYPQGIATSSTGDILVADCDTNSLIHLSESGEYISDFLTEDDGLEFPIDLCVDGNQVCVGNRYEGINMYMLM